MIVLEFSNNGTLYDVLNMGKILTESQILKIFKGVCNGLEYIHSKNIIHRDIKVNLNFIIVLKHSFRH